jgi:hypothetical protein
MSMAAMSMNARQSISPAADGRRARRTAVENLDQSEIAIEYGGRTLTFFLLQRMEAVPLARNAIVPGLRDADKRPSGLKFVAREAVIQRSLQTVIFGLPGSSNHGASSGCLASIARHREGRGRVLVPG